MEDDTCGWRAGANRTSDGKRELKKGDTLQPMLPGESDRFPEEAAGSYRSVLPVVGQFDFPAASMRALAFFITQSALGNSCSHFGSFAIKPLYGPVNPVRRSKPRETRLGLHISEHQMTNSFNWVLRYLGSG